MFFLSISFGFLFELFFCELNQFYRLVFICIFKLFPKYCFLMNLYYILSTCSLLSKSFLLTRFSVVYLCIASVMYTTTLCHHQKALWTGESLVSVSYEKIPSFCCLFLFRSIEDIFTSLQLLGLENHIYLGGGWWVTPVMTLKLALLYFESFFILFYVHWSSLLLNLIS